MKEQLLPLGNKLKGIILGGPGITVNDFVNYDYLTGELKKKILGTKDLSYTEEFGLQELLDKSADLLGEEEVAQEKRIMLRFFTQMRDSMQKVTYGEKETIHALDLNSVDVLLLSESLPEEKIAEFEDRALKGGKGPDRRLSVIRKPQGLVRLPAHTRPHGHDRRKERRAPCPPHKDRRRIREGVRVRRGEGLNAH